MELAADVRRVTLGALAIVSLLAADNVTAYAQAANAKKPNILVIFGDDIGYSNISAYNLRIMGYHTPNIDRVAQQGALFTDYYAQQSCTAGRAAFITGQSPFRTGLLKVGLPGADLGLQPHDPTIADLLKGRGYMTFQNGKNHLGDRNEFLPTVHGFDEFFGNFYHLNAEEELENVDYPKNPAFMAKFGPRSVFKCKATATDNPAPPDPRFGPWGKQVCEDTGPLTQKRMETADEEFLAKTLADMESSVKAGKPFFIWHNTTRMHVWNAPPAEVPGDGCKKKVLYGAGMSEFDDNIGVMLKRLDDLGIADNTIVIITTDNGAETFSWPDGGTTPFRGEKNTNWEGGYRVPFVMRWPGVIKPGTIINDIRAHEDWATTLMATAGEPDIKQKLLTGYQSNGRTFKVHLDGYNLTDLLAGKGPGPRKEFFYWTDDGELAGLRYEKWKLVFLEQREHGFGVWSNPFIPLRVLLIEDLHADPYELASYEASDYPYWILDRIYLLVPAQAFVGQFLMTFRDFPARQKAASFSLDQVMQRLQEGIRENN